MSLELLFLGTGTSAGVPMIGCHCRVCRSPDPRDNRTRPSGGYTPRCRFLIALRTIETRTPLTVI